MGETFVKIRGEELQKAGLVKEGEGKLARKRHDHSTIPRQIGQANERFLRQSHLSQGSHIYREWTCHR